MAAGRNRFALMEGTGALLPKKRAKKAPPRITLPERQLQALAEALLDRLGVRYIRVPDALLSYLARAPDAWVRVFVSSYLAGIPDLNCLRPIPGTPYNLSLNVELKTERGKRRQSQTKWAEGLNVPLAVGWDDFEALALRFHTAPLEQLLPAPRKELS